MSLEQEFDALIIARKSGYIYKNCLVAALTIYAFDYILIIRKEVTLVWRSRQTFGSVAYMLNRISLGIAMALLFISLNAAHIKKDFALVLQYTEGSCLVIVQTCTNVLWIMRTYAVSNHNKYVLVILLFLLSTAIVIAWVEVATYKFGSAYSLSFTIENGTAEGLLLLFDLVVICITIGHSYKTACIQATVGRTKTSFMYLLLKQGINRFIIIFVIFLMSMITSLLSNVLPNNLFYIVSLHSQVIQCSITSRYFLDVREMHKYSIPNVSLESFSGGVIQTEIFYADNLTPHQESIESIFDVGPVENNDPWVTPSERE